MIHCPKCSNDLSEEAESGATTGMWTFRIVCECGRHYLWRQGRIFAMRTASTPSLSSVSH